MNICIELINNWNNENKFYTKSEYIVTNTVKFANSKNYTTDNRYSTSYQ